jgi:hypothetical protein
MGPLTSALNCVELLRDFLQRTLDEVECYRSLEVCARKLGQINHRAQLILRAIRAMESSDRAA